MAFGVFGGISFIGLVLSWGIRGANLEDYEWDDAHRDADEEDDVDEESEAERDGADEQTPLINEGSK